MCWKERWERLLLSTISGCNPSEHGNKEAESVWLLPIRLKMTVERYDYRYRWLSAGCSDASEERIVIG